MPIKIPLFRGGEVLGFLRMGGGWKCQFYFNGRGDFSEQGVLRGPRMASQRLLGPKTSQNLSGLLPLFLLPLNLSPGLLRCLGYL